MPTIKCGEFNRTAGHYSLSHRPRGAKHGRGQATDAGNLRNVNDIVGALATRYRHADRAKAVSIVYVVQFLTYG